MIWFKKYELEDINRICLNTLVSHLSIEFIDIGEDYLAAKMPVTNITVQPQGILHGGASAALAETIGSVAAFMCVDPALYNCVGLEINCNHLKAKTSGNVIGTGRPFHIGKKIQVWEIKIFDEKEILIGISRLTLAVLKKT